MALELGLDQIQPQLEKLARLPKPARMAVLAGIPVLVLVVYVSVFAKPLHQQIRNVRSQQLNLQRKLSEVRSVAANEQAVKDEIGVLQKKLGVALQQLPDSKELPVLLTDITSLGKNAGLDFKSFKPDVEVQKAFYAEVPIDIEFTGHFHDVASFFDEVSKLPRIVNISELDMKIAKESSRDTTLDVKGKATTYRFVDTPPGSAASGAAAAVQKPGARPAPRARGGHR
jgi:type IV pilus assembly protein PilO